MSEWTESLFELVDLWIDHCAAEQTIVAPTSESCAQETRTCRMELLPDEQTEHIQPMRCTACGHKTYAQLPNYCPHCGRKVFQP